MSINQVSSTTTVYSQWSFSTQQSTRTAGCRDLQDGDGDGDSATISSQGFAALLAGSSASTGTSADASQADSCAARIGARIQEKDPALFTQVDSNGDGTLSAQELHNGRDLLHTAHAAHIGQTIASANPALFAALDRNADGTLSPQELSAGKDLLAGISPSASSATAVDGTAGTPSTGKASHHGHHHHPNADDQGASGQPTGLAALFGNASTMDGSTSDDDSANGSDPFAFLTPATGQAQFQTNALTDVLQQLFGQTSQS